MAKTLVIVANTKSGDQGEIEVECPENLEEAVQMFGKLEVFKGFLRDRAVIWQRNARPVADKQNGTPKKRVSMLDRLANS